MKLKISISVFANIVLLIMMGVFYALIGESDFFKEYGYYVVAIGSAVLLAIAFIELRKSNVGMLSFSCVFILLLHIFSFGNFYLKALGLEEYYLFGDWFRSDRELKSASGYFALCTSEAILIGILISLQKTRNHSCEYNLFLGLDEKATKRILYRAGCILFAVTLPCRLYIDYTYILQSSLTGEYQGFSGMLGLADDLQTLFIPALICIMYGKRERVLFCKAILMIYTILCAFVMAASGSRRYYVTAILAIFLFYFNTKPNADRKKHHNPFAAVGLIMAGIMVLNFMTMIRNYRHSVLGILGIFQGHAEDLFSLDFLWESMSEFGLTGNVVYHSFKHFPSSVRFQYGFSYLASFIYILPIGWLIHLEPSIGNILYNLTGSAVGGSLVADLYGNFGWFALFPAILLGYVISNICYADKRIKKTSVKTAVSYASCYSLINYVRSSTPEIMRYTAYTIISIYFLSMFLKHYESKGV